MFKITSTVFVIFVCISFLIVGAKKTKEKPEWAKKDIRDFSDADMERLLDQWDVSFLFCSMLCKNSNNTIF